MTHIVVRAACSDSVATLGLYANDLREEGVGGRSPNDQSIAQNTQSQRSNLSC